MLLRRSIWIALLLAAAALAWSYWSQRLVIPEEWSLWKPLRIAAPPGFLTRYKLSKLSNDSALCHEILATASLEYERLTDRDTAPECGLHNAVRIDRTTAEVGDPFSLTCRAAASLALWERHSLQPAARSYFGSPIAMIEHFGSYSCRNIYNRPNAARSRHATAEAFDVAGFILADGRRIRILHDWRKDSAEGHFLREVRTGACQFFDAVLSPDYNAPHRDHLHLDRGPYRICR